MEKDLAVLDIAPSAGVPGGELLIDCTGYDPGLSSKVFLGEIEAYILTSSSERVIVRLPENPRCLGITLKCGDKTSQLFPFSLAVCLSDSLHPVANPVVAPDGSIITTNSGSRGQKTDQSLMRVTKRGDKIPFHCEIMNPTGLAFSRDGQLYISSRHDGTVLRYVDFAHLEVFAEDLGIACGIVFDSRGILYVGDRSGRIIRIDSAGAKDEFALLEPSISAYHLAVDAEDRLYVTGPTFSMRDCLYRFSSKGAMEILFRGLARPQGMAFLPGGDLLLAAAYQGKKGLFRFSAKTGELTHYITAPMLVGLAVSGQDLFLANNSSIYWMQLPGERKKII